MVQASTLTDDNNQTEQSQQDGYLSDDLSNDEDGHPKVFTKLAQGDEE